MAENQYMQDGTMLNKSANNHNLYSDKNKHNKYSRKGVYNHLYLVKNTEE